MDATRLSTRTDGAVQQPTPADNTSRPASSSTATGAAAATPSSSAAGGPPPLIHQHHRQFVYEASLRPTMAIDSHHRQQGYHQGHGGTMMMGTPTRLSAQSLFSAMYQSQEEEQQQQQQDDDRDVGAAVGDEGRAEEEEYEAADGTADDIAFRSPSKGDHHTIMGDGHDCSSNAMAMTTVNGPPKQPSLRPTRQSEHLQQVSKRREALGPASSTSNTDTGTKPTATTATDNRQRGSRRGQQLAQYHQQLQQHTRPAIVSTREAGGAGLYAAHTNAMGTTTATMMVPSGGARRGASSSSSSSSSSASSSDSSVSGYHPSLGYNPLALSHHHDDDAKQRKKMMRKLLKRKQAEQTRRRNPQQQLSAGTVAVPSRRGDAKVRVTSATGGVVVDGVDDDEDGKSNIDTDDLVDTDDGSGSSTAHTHSDLDVMEGCDDDEADGTRPEGVEDEDAQIPAADCVGLNSGLQDTAQHRQAPPPPLPFPSNASVTSSSANNRRRNGVEVSGSNKYRHDPYATPTKGGGASVISGTTTSDHQHQHSDYRGMAVGSTAAGHHQQHRHNGSSGVMSKTLSIQSHPHHRHGGSSGKGMPSYQQQHNQQRQSKAHYYDQLHSSCSSDDGRGEGKGEEGWVGGDGGRGGYDRPPSYHQHQLQSNSSNGRTPTPSIIPTPRHGDPNQHLMRHSGGGDSSSRPLSGIATPTQGVVSNCRAATLLTSPSSGGGTCTNTNSAKLKTQQHHTTDGANYPSLHTLLDNGNTSSATPTAAAGAVVGTPNSAGRGGGGGCGSSRSFPNALSGTTLTNSLVVGGGAVGGPPSYGGGSTGRLQQYGGGGGGGWGPQSSASARPGGGCGGGGGSESVASSPSYATSNPRHHQHHGGGSNSVRNNNHTATSRHSQQPPPPAYAPSQHSSHRSNHNMTPTSGAPPPPLPTGALPPAYQYHHGGGGGPASSSGYGGGGGGGRERGGGGGGGSSTASAIMSSYGGGGGGGGGNSSSFGAPTYFGGGGGGGGGGGAAMNPTPNHGKNVHSDALQNVATFIPYYDAYGGGGGGGGTTGGFGGMGTPTGTTDSNNGTATTTATASPFPSATASASKGGASPTATATPLLQPLVLRVSSLPMERISSAAADMQDVFDAVCGYVEKERDKERERAVLAALAQLATAGEEDAPKATATGGFSTAGNGVSTDAPTSADTSGNSNGAAAAASKSPSSQPAAQPSNTTTSSPTPLLFQTNPLTLSHQQLLQPRRRMTVRVDGAEKSHKSNSVYVYISTAEEADTIVAAFQRVTVLMDRRGFHIAKGAEERAAMAAYCDRIRNLPQRARHWRMDGLPSTPISFKMM